MDLSSSELAVLRDRDFFLLKRSVAEKLDRLFAELQQDRIKEVVRWKLPHPGIDIQRGKIFRGENYLGFPYVIMDFPKYFGRDSVFAVRTMCWWGNEFSITLHLQGRSLESYRERLPERLAAFNGADAFACINSTPWEYGFSADNYKPLESLKTDDVQAHMETYGFMKLARRLPLDQSRNFPDFGKETFERIGRFLGE